MSTARAAILPFTLLAIATLGACDHSGMRSYVSRDLSNVIFDYGTPANAFDMPDGRRAFQWRLNLEHVPPTYRNAEPVTRYGEMAWTSTHTPVYGGQPLTEKCVYTVFADWVEPRHVWTVKQFRRPSVVCR